MASPLPENQARRRPHAPDSLVREGADAVQCHVDFRDYPIAHPPSADAYASLKTRLAERFGADIEGYANAKKALVRDVESDAAVWRVQGGHHEAAT